ncbi:hypothetical protein [Verrucosispora sp. WMMD1129]|uniref:hypothetical protein n=1 Tax=Verrucosispora sp. WMMD1129 TaxID=3016093 RepID=UPI00249C457C|nr:hypothetical protein [Verrucosispora sp. WMMD1129]WFE46297.1 hypothetical protein O7624_19065 [Verrucosispora sp. WMMD1129]
MSIIASASVPPEQRLHDAPTADIPAITRPRPADDRFPVLNSGAHRGDERTPQPAGTGSAFDDGYAHGYADAVGHAVASRPAGPSAATMELGRKVELLIGSTDMKPAEIAAQLGVSVAEALDAHIDRICWQEGAHHLVGKRPAAETLNDAERACPTWCQRDHSSEETEFEGFTVGSIHTLDLAEITGSDPESATDVSVAEVVVEMSSEAGQVIDPTRVVVRFADPADRTGTRQMGWSGTADQVEALGVALIRAAQVARQDAS